MEGSANVLRFAEARASEISSLMNDISYQKKTAFQKLPPHMRRRAASHNPKRVPRKLRESYLIQNPHATSKPKKAPKNIRKKQQKKKHEKQAKDYPKEYASRSRPDGIWLETHIWHAKRCKMENLWGYKLPIHCNDKKLGATHQAATKHVMLQDLSYYCCIELKGPENQLISALSSLTNPDTGSHFGSEMYRSGTREGHTFLYQPHKFPYEAIGPVTFIWEPWPGNLSDIEIQTVPCNVRKLWIWCHPTFHDEAVAVLVEVFHLEEVAKEDTLNHGSNVKDDSETFASKVNFEKTKQHFQKDIKYVNGDILMSLLKDKLVRHRLIGPNAQSVLTNVLALATIEENVFNNDVVSDSSSNKLNGDLQKSHSSKKQKLDNLVDAEELCSTVPKKRKLDAFINTTKPYGEYSEFILETKNDTKESKLLVFEDKTEFDSGSIKGHCNEKLNEGPLAKKIKFCKLEETEVAYSNTSDCDLWWQSYYKNENAKASHRKKKKLFECFQNGRSGYYISPSTVIGLTVRDPRLILSRDKRKVIQVEGSSDIGECLEELLSSGVADSPIWNCDIRNEVTRTQISESEINKERSKYFIPSESLDLGNKESRVPILLIHQPGTNGFGSGWDLIAPLGWGMPFWIPLILNGGRATGLRDLHFVNLEIGQPSFPLSYPDSQAGATFEETLRVDELTIYYKRPKAKRANFTTFGIPNPFFMPWDILIDDWLKELRIEENNILFPIVSPNDVQNISFNKTDNKVGFFVLRQKEIRQLQILCEQLTKLSRSKASRKPENSHLKKMYNDIVRSSLNSQKEFSNSVVLVRLKCLTRGCPSVHSGIYALSDSDLQEVKNNPHFLGPVEPNHTQSKTDPHSSKSSYVEVKKESIDIDKEKLTPENSTFNKESSDYKEKSSGAKEGNDKEKSSPAKERNEEVKSSGSKEGNDKEKSSHAKEINEEEKSSLAKEGNNKEKPKPAKEGKDNKTVCKEVSKSSSHNQINPKDLVKPHIQSLMSSSSRKIIGYLSEGGFSSIMGKGCGIGHCSLIGLLCALKNSIETQIPPFVLIREQHSFQYRVSLLEIIPNYF